MGDQLDVTRFGADPGNPDNLSAIQKAWDSGKVGDTVYIPPAEFWVRNDPGLQARPGVNLQIDGTLKAVPNKTQAGALLHILHTVDVTVFGSGGILGDRTQDDFNVPELTHMHAIRCEFSERINIRQISANMNRGDGIYVEGCKDTLVEFTRCQNNKRNAMSLINGERIKIQDNTMALTNGPDQMPCAGLDIEPDPPRAAQTLVDIVVQRNRLIRNKGCGIYRGFDVSANTKRIFVVQNSYDQHFKDGSGPPMRGGGTDKTAWMIYSILRWWPGYDWWGFPTEFTIS